MRVAPGQIDRLPFVRHHLTPLRLFRPASQHPIHNRAVRCWHADGPHCSRECIVSDRIHGTRPSHRRPPIPSIHSAQVAEPIDPSAEAPPKRIKQRNAAPERDQHNQGMEGVEEEVDSKVVRRARRAATSEAEADTAGRDKRAATDRKQVNGMSEMDRADSKAPRRASRAAEAQSGKEKDRNAGKSKKQAKDVPAMDAIEVKGQDEEWAVECIVDKFVYKCTSNRIFVRVGHSIRRSQAQQDSALLLCEVAWVSGRGQHVGAGGTPHCIIVLI